MSNINSLSSFPSKRTFRNYPISEITLIYLIVTNYSHKMSANMDVTLAVHFDVPNVDYESPTSQNINWKSVPQKNCKALFFLCEVNECCPETKSGSRDT